MLVVVPNCQGRVSPVFDVAARLLLVRLKGQAEVEREEVVLFEKEPEEIVRSLQELGIKVLICEGISQGLQVSLEQAGIEVVAHICGELESVLAAYRTSKLNRPEFFMPGCCRQEWGERHRTGQHCRRRKRLRRAFHRKVLEQK